MKKDTHPAYQDVLFVDSASGHRFVCGSTLQPNAKEVFQGVEYPVCHLSISSSSHPFFTGSKQLVDSEGRVEKFKKRFGKSTAPVAAVSAEQDSAADQGSQEQEPKEKKEAAKPAKAKKK